MKYTPSLLRKVAFSLTIFGLMISFGVATLGQSASALSGSEFNASNIIDDSVFFDKSSMSAAEIQAFLNAKLPVCDTNGSQPYAGTTRAAYGASRGYPAPYTCLKDYSQAIPAKSADVYCSGGVGAGTKSAAQIIYDVSQACGVSPKVLLILLQKEQSLVTDDWPWSIQYRSATGFGCPDTAACDSTYYGYFNQVYNAARQYQRYIVQADYFNYAAGRTSFVSYQANAPDCGGTNLTIQNGATAGLYNYTPYQPNAAALANLYGTGDNCSAYGNRNFWRMFNDWFGSTTGPEYGGRLSSYLLYSNPGRTLPVPQVNSKYIVQPGQTIYATVGVTNTGRSSWDTNARIATTNSRDRRSTFANNSWIAPHRVVSVGPLQINQSLNVQFSLTTPTTNGDYNESFGIVVDGKAWTGASMNLVIGVTTATIVPNGYIKNILENNQSISGTQNILSSDGYSTLSLENGKIKLRTDFVTVWEAGTNGSRLVLQGDGNLVLYNASGQATWATYTNGQGPSRLVLQSDGNLVLYNASGQATWATYTILPLSHHNYPYDTLRNNGVMVINQLAQDMARKHTLVLQGDGNLVLYSSGRPIWATYTVSSGATYAIAQGDGNLVLYNASGRAVWNSGTAGKGASTLIAQGDGNLVLYNASGQATWATYTNGR